VTAAAARHSALAGSEPTRYGVGMDRDAIRGYVGRQWAALADAKRAWHARRFREHGAAPGVALAQALWEHVRGIRPDWPTAADRERDLAHHVELKRQLDRTAHAFARR
jgi:hypothetical protein